MGFFDTFLAKVPTEDQAVLNKYPELKASVDKLEQYTGEWVNWQQQYWDPETNQTKVERQLREELAAAQERLTAGADAGLGAQDMAALRTEFDTKLKAVEKQSLQTIEGMHRFYQTTAKHLLPHQKEFGDNLEPGALMEFMQKQGINDPDLAYDKMVAGRRAELATQREKETQEKHAAELEAARQEGYEKRAKEVAMGPGGMLPTDGSGGISGVTSRIDAPAKISDEVKERLSSAKLGDGSLSALGYEMWRRGDFSDAKVQ